MEIREGAVTVAVSDGALPPIYAPFGELLRLHPARYSVAADDLAYPAQFSVRVGDVDAHLLEKLMGGLLVAMRIVAPPYQVNFRAYFVRGDAREVTLQMAGEPVFSMVT